MVAGEEIPAVGRPDRTVDEPALLPGHLAETGSIRMNHPEVRSAVAIAREGDERAIGTETRLHVEGGAAREPSSRSSARAFDRHEVQIAEDVEDDRLSVRAHVEIDPRSFIGLEVDWGRWAEGLRHVPLGVVF